MTLYLRTKENKVIFSAMVYIESNESRKSFVELSAVVNITNYSNFLLDKSNLNKAKIINDFDYLSELRGWLWERFFITVPNDETQKDKVVEKLRVILNKVAKDYNLLYVEG